jgi:hypothetical protein
MKKLFMTMLVIAVCAGLYAQDSFFPAKAGVVLTYANNDAKGNTESYTVLTIKDVKGSGKNMTITYGAKTLDKNRKPSQSSPGEQILKVTIKDDVTILDINQTVPGDMRGQGVKIEAKGTPMELPNNLKPGQALKISNITVTMDLGVMKTSSVVKTEGKCLAIEDVKVPAGTFKCHKITQKSIITVLNTNTVQTTISWYAPNIGTVKTEGYDENNKLTSGSVLVELKK